MKKILKKVSLIVFLVLIVALSSTKVFADVAAPTSSIVPNNIAIIGIVIMVIISIIVAIVSGIVLFIYVKKGDSKENASNNANINVNNAPAVGAEFGSTPVNTNNSNNEQGE